MTSRTHELIAAFGAVEDDQHYTRLVEHFADDAVYYDPFLGPQVGTIKIHEFMTLMEKHVPAAGARFANWQVAAGIKCGYAEWTMVAPNTDGIDVAVPGESLYRLRDGLVIGVVDYVDPVAYTRLRGEGAKTPDLRSGSGCLPAPHTPAGPVADELRSHVEAMTYAGRWTGSAELVDYCGDGDSGSAGSSGVGWAQWIFDGPHGRFAGWSLRRPGGTIRDFFDTVTADQLATAI